MSNLSEIKAKMKEDGISFEQALRDLKRIKRLRAIMDSKTSIPISIQTSPRQVRMDIIDDAPKETLEHLIRFDPRDFPPPPPWADENWDHLGNLVDEAEFLSPEIPSKEERPDIDKRVYREPPPKKEKKKRTRIDIIREKLKEKEKEDEVK